jgi:uncharacterized protein (TIGR03083 family)
MPRSPLLDHSRAERLALVDMFASLDEAQLATQSLCAAWTVRDVLAHLATPALLSNADIAKQFLRKPSFHAATVAWSERLASSSTEELIDGLRRTADDPFIPPVVGPAGPLTDAVIHGEDARHPLGLRRDVPEPHLREILDFGLSRRAQPVFVPFRRLRGVRFVATDLDWSGGQGAVVEGPALQVALAMFGRIGAAPDLTGDGVAVLAAR